jgi:hypothetical protein
VNGRTEPSLGRGSRARKRPETVVKRVATVPAEELTPTMPPLKNGIDAACPTKEGHAKQLGSMGRNRKLVKAHGRLVGKSGGMGG